jgi:hypothetical protein
VSAVAEFKKLPQSALQGLKNAAQPTKKFFGGTRDDYEKYLAENGLDVAEYNWSGFVLSTLLPYLQERHGIDLMRSEHDDIAMFLTNARGATHFIFTQSHRSEFLSRLNFDSFSVSEMRDYFNEFNGTKEEEIGSAMRDGVRALQTSLEQVDSQSIILFRIV